MPAPVVVVGSGGVPVVDATPVSGNPSSNPNKVNTPLTPVSSGTRPVTIVASGAPAVVFVSANGQSWLRGGV
jgi:hypothetical protein